MKKRPKGQSPRVVIAIPLAGPMIYWRTVASLLEMERPGPSDLMVFQGALVDRARNRLIEKMLEHPLAPTHLLFLDADIAPVPDTLLQLLRHKRPIVSGLYRKRLPPFEPMAFVGKKPISLKGPRLRKADWVGAGCLLIRREVFEKIRPPWFTSDWGKGDSPKDGHLSEDFSFCEKARGAGFDIYVDAGVRPLHLEPVGIGTGQNGGVEIVPMVSE